MFELVEGFVEKIYMFICDCWGILDLFELMMEECFCMKYRGIWVLFGYLVCLEFVD